MQEKVIQRDILDEIQDHIALISHEGEILFTNQSWQKFADSLGQKWLRPINGNFVESLQEPLFNKSDTALQILLSFKEVVNGEKNTASIIYSFNSESRKRFTFELSITNSGDYISLIHRDISAESYINDYLWDSEQKFQHHFDNSLIGILTVDHQNKIIETNSHACSLIGLSRDKILSLNIESVFDVETDLIELQKKINREGNYFGEHSILNNSDYKVTVELSVNVFRDHEKQLVSTWTFKDITDKKKTEKALQITDQNYKLQFDNLLTGTIIALSEGKILEVNSALCNIVGFTKEELQGNNLDLIIDRDLLSNKQYESELQEKQSYSGELTFKNKSGKEIPVEASAAVFVDDTGSEKVIININDISRRKEIRNKLDEEREFINSAIASMPTALFVIDSDGILIRWNGVLEQEFEYSSEELDKLSILELVHPDDLSKGLDYITKGLNGESIKEGIKCKSKSGKTLHFMVSAQRFIQDGKIYIVGSGINRNDIIYAESEMRKNAEMFSQLFYNAPVGVVQINTNGKIENTNSSFNEIFGYEDVSLTGTDLNKLITPEDLKSEAENFTRTTHNGNSFQTESLRLRRDGSEVPVLIGGLPVKLDDEIISIYGLYVDISERKKLENRVIELMENEKKARIHMQDMFDEAPSAIAMLEGPDHTFTYCNEEFRKLTGVCQPEGHSITTILPEIEMQGLSEKLCNCYSNGVTFHFNEHKVQFKNRKDDKLSTHYLNFVFKPLRDDQNNIYGIFVDAVDITEQVQSRNIIKESLKEKEILLNEVHHRVKNNLAIITGLIELELMETDDDVVAEHFNTTKARIYTIAHIHELLYKNNSFSQVSFDSYLKNYLGKASLPKGADLEFELQLEEAHLNVNKAIPTAMLLNEIFACIKLAYTQAELIYTRLDLSIREEEGIIRIDINSIPEKVAAMLSQKCSTETALRKELISVLLTQIDGKLNFDQTGSIVITFQNREIRGPYSAIIPTNE